MGPKRVEPAARADKLGRKDPTPLALLGLVEGLYVVLMDGLSQSGSVTEYQGENGPGKEIEAPDQEPAQSAATQASE